MERQTIIVDCKADREALAVILVRAGYSVWQVKTRKASGTTVYKIEFWREHET